MAKSISASVGQGGINLPNDVLTVQFLLNSVPDNDGGPNPELVMDGLVGPKTIGAINQFQKAHFGWNDGRVDPESRGGVTIVELNKFDPTPNVPSLPPLPRFPGSKGPPMRFPKRPGKKVGGRIPGISPPNSTPIPNPLPFPGKKIGGKGFGKKQTGGG